MQINIDVKGYGQESKENRNHYQICNDQQIIFKGAFLGLRQFS